MLAAGRRRIERRAPGETARSRGRAGGAVTAAGGAGGPARAGACARSAYQAPEDTPASAAALAPYRQTVHAHPSGGRAAAIPTPANPAIRMLPGQQGTIQVGSKLDDKSDKLITDDDTIKIDLTPSVGC